jgi:hypothetical protein
MENVMENVMSSVIAGGIASGVASAVSDAADAAKHLFDGAPHLPPPPPLAPPPTWPPSEPPVQPPAPPLIVCPPMAPPPMSPPGFHVWAAQVPPWFWGMFVGMVMFACCGVVAIVYILKELRAQRLGLKLPQQDTIKSLAMLEARMTRRGM